MEGGMLLFTSEEYPGKFLGNFIILIEKKEI